MKTRFRLLLSASFLAVAACGTSSKAPVVYGASSDHDARVYNSRAEFASHRDYIEAQQAAIEARKSRERVALAKARAASQPVASTRSVRTSVVEPTTLRNEPASLHLTNTGRPSRSSASLRADRFIAEVQRGDTVYALGRRYDVDPKTIIRVNNLKAPYHLDVGQRIRLPRTATLQERPLTAQKTTKRATVYTVRDGDTLYSISRDTRTPLSQIAKSNGLRKPYRLHAGQRLELPGSVTLAQETPRSRPVRTASTTGSIYTSAVPPKPEPVSRKDKAKNVTELARNVSYTPATSSGSKFNWPVKGAVVANYGVSDFGRRNDGVNIAAPAGTPVRAAANGEVVYRGSELDGFGNLLLIKHAEGYVTAYAHTDAMLVKNGEIVRQGQVIAKVGQTGAVSSPQLHFEVRRNLKAVDPTALLGEQ